MECNQKELRSAATTSVAQSEAEVVVAPSADRQTVIDRQSGEDRQVDRSGTAAVTLSG